MARKYLHNETEIGWEAKKGDDRYLRFDVSLKPRRVEAASFDPPPLTRKNATDLRDWLTAWLERTK